MARHMKYECGKLPMFGCSICPYRGYQKTHVERHLSRKHNVLLKSDIIRAITFFGKKEDLTRGLKSDVKFV
ncbi:Longitudinals lacking protein, isoforms A/B/D/L-like Protein [Tribolium castaneum]|uniref:Longitudinals lacking protein, isoforms A/B/D/L-like Protein n=1 Tax=Tribolium castaneum TaxID=7070 RepID=D6WFD1_TRICA|nr:Longitudinals lacking protein, isoforms A/B/D/L-like Protein [Tribolium castaneum]